MTAAPQGTFAKLVRGGPSAAKAVPIIAGTNMPGVMVSKIFDFQSYFDDTLLQQALLIQSSNEPIVGSTAQPEGIGGYCVANAPWSQTPIAFLPQVGGSNAGQQPVTLKPGQIYRPNGKPGAGSGHFSSFIWGLPYGWLGGGLATVIVFPSPDADVAWAGNNEVIFHRQRMRILAPAGLPAAAPKNWPLRFPWPEALRGSLNISQAGAALLAVEPTRVLMSLRLASLGTASEMRILYHEDNDFDLDSTGAVIATNTRFIDTIWGTYSATGGAGIGLLNTYPVMEFNGAVARIAADNGGISLVDVSAGGGITNAYVDVVRYGRL